MKILFKILIYIHVIILILSFVSCNKLENSKNNSEDSIKSEDTKTEPINDISESEAQAQKNAAIENKIYNILDNTQVHPNFAPTIGNMVVKVFYKYNITWEPYLGSSSKYSVKISGTYCPNPDIRNLSMNGSITYLVDIDNSTCSIQSDPDNISATFLVFIVN